MAAARPTSDGATRSVTLIGDNDQVLQIALLFVGGKINVHVATASDLVLERLAPYPGVTVNLVPSGYGARPEALPGPPYFLCVNDEATARIIHGWLPPTVAVFHCPHDRAHRAAAAGFLSVVPSQVQHRARLLARLEILARVDRLCDLGRRSKRPLILMYGDPDPDSIGAALGLAELWRAVGIEAKLRYTGEIRRYQNQLLLQWLKQPIQRLGPDERAEADLIAVVDAQPGFWRDDPPLADIVIDHHPRLPTTQATYEDLREGIGATASILTEYLDVAGVPIRRSLATALLYGLATDTADLRRNTTALDIRAFDLLHEKADRHFLSRLNKNQFPQDMLDDIAWGMLNRVVVGELLLVHFGDIATPDVLVQAADLLLLTFGINWVVCAGTMGDGLTCVFRGDGHQQDVGARAKQAFGKIGSAGGHRTMGRAEVPLKGIDAIGSVAVVVDNLFRRGSSRRRQQIAATLRERLLRRGDGNGRRAVGG